MPKDPVMVYTMGGRIVTFLDLKMLNTHYSCSCELIYRKLPKPTLTLQAQQFSAVEMAASRTLQTVPFAFARTVLVEPCALKEQITDVEAL